MNEQNETYSRPHPLDSIIDDTPDTGTDFEELFNLLDLIESSETVIPDSGSIEPTVDSVDPFTLALEQANESREKRLLESFEEQNPVFSYGKVSEEIIDKESTFDMLREKYETDFPELSDKKKVSWTVNYGKVTKSISNPESEKIFDIKGEIEKSKAFFDGVKKAKKDEDKAPKCYVKPKITAQSKGEACIPSYKDYVCTLEAAEQSDKPIVIIPSKSGQIYELRKTEVGTFLTPADNLPEFPDLESSFNFHLPKIPNHLLHLVISFFRNLSDKSELEALVHILYNKENHDYQVAVPPQKVSHASVLAQLDTDYPDHIIHLMDIHSHNTCRQFLKRMY